jgi:hypothetical protein
LKRKPDECTLNAINHIPSHFVFPAKNDTVTQFSLSNVAPIPEPRIYKRQQAGGQQEPVDSMEEEHDWA